MSEPFRVGDRVAVVGARVPEMHRVARVLKRYVELDDGSRWALTGVPYPRQDWPKQHIEHWEDEHERRARIAQALVVARNVVERLREPSASVVEVRELVDRLQAMLHRIEE